MRPRQFSGGAKVMQASQLLDVEEALGGDGARRHSTGRSMAALLCLVEGDDG
jgi:hypothetical protein